MGPKRRRQFNRVRLARQRESQQFLERVRVPGDLPGLLALHRRALFVDPADLSSRFLLANCLYASGEQAEAEAEWDRVSEAGVTWAELVAETRLSCRPGESQAGA